MLIIDAKAVDAALDYPALIAALDRAFRDPPVQPVRHAHAISSLAGAADNTLLLMPAWQQPGVGAAFMGIKIVGVAPGNGAKGLSAVQASYLLFDAETCVAMAMIDGHALTVKRTAAASALAASRLARADASRLLMVGAGGLAPELIRAHATVRPITSVEIWNRSTAKAEALARSLSGDGLKVRAVTDLDAACTRADVISVATLSTEALVKGDHVRPGTHVDLVGAFTPAMRESDSALIARAEIFVDTRSGALKEAGDLVQAAAAGAFSAERVKGDLTDLARGITAGRTDDRAITVFKSVGAALEDLAAAVLVVAKTA